LQKRKPIPDLLMRVAFLYNRSSEDPAHAAEDEVPARSPVVAAIKRLGHELTPIACTLDLAAVRRRLLRAKPDVAFNRVESLGGSDSMMAAITLLLDAMQIPYTGNSSAALTTTASKVFVKEQLQNAGLPTPAWLCLAVGHEPHVRNPQSAMSLPATAGNPKFILKSIYEHASFQMGDESVVQMTSIGQIQELLRELEALSGKAHFAEQFIDGREFNLSLIGSEPRVLTPAEIDFSAFPAGKHRIVGHSAKWDCDSFEYHNTDRRFDYPASDQPLLRRLTELARECWRLFDLTGYARVDFRVDEAGEPCILEVNTNPCTSPDAGFAAALEHDGIGYDGGIERILDDALTRSQTAACRRVYPSGDEPRRSQDNRTDSQDNRNCHRNVLCRQQPTIS
jgi:D-alanine-D-alanine ligase